MLAPLLSVPRFRSVWRMGVCCCVGLAMFATACLADTVVLTSGEILVGTVVSESDATVVFDSSGLGKVSVPRDRILRIEKGAVASTATPGAQEMVAPAVPPGEEVAQTAAPLPPPKKIRVRPFTQPGEGEDQLQWSKPWPIFSSSRATNRPLFLSRTIKLGASGRGILSCRSSMPLEVQA